MASVGSQVVDEMGTRSVGRVHQILAHPRLVIGGVVLILLIGSAVVAPLLSLHPPDAINISEGLRPPSLTYPFGTDVLGRDNLSRVLFGGRLTFVVVAASVLLSSAVGVALGLVSGYQGGWLDGLIMRVMDGILAFPGLVLALTIEFALGISAAAVIIALSVVEVPAFARLARAQTLALRRAEFIEASRAIGVPTPRIIYRHLLPNMVDVLLVLMSIAAGQTIFTAASLSFLGLGLPPPAPSWGGMLHDGYPYLQIAPWECLIPGSFIFLAVLGFNFLGDGLRDLFDPARRSSPGKAG